ncbi:MAG: hypothetical protein QG599_2492 [Pseudomonadota bacterium]|nr:hypothetical protein [Pseudomonadota bacterium]
MKKIDFPPDWDEARVQRVIAHYEGQTEDEAVAEDEIGFKAHSQSVMIVPNELAPVVRELIARHQLKEAA